MAKKRKKTTKKAAFLAAYSELGNITSACGMADCSRSQVYKWMDLDPEFKAAFEAAEGIAVEHLEQEARRRAVEGTLRPVYQGGRKVGTIREFSDTLLIFLLKGAHPTKYRENVHTQHSGKVDVGAVIQVVENPNFYGNAPDDHRVPAADAASVADPAVGSAV